MTKSTEKKSAFTVYTSLPGLIHQPAKWNTHINTNGRFITLFFINGYFFSHIKKQCLELYVIGRRFFTIDQNNWNSQPSIQQLVSTGILLQ